MERYELRNGDVYEIIPKEGKYVVVKNGDVVCYGTYERCRNHVERARKSRNVEVRKASKHETCLSCGSRERIMEIEVQNHSNVLGLCLCRRCAAELCSKIGSWREEYGTDN